MKRIHIISLTAILFLFNSYVQAQVRKLPSTIDTTAINPEEIPSPEKLRLMGASAKEIEQITEFKKRKLAEKNAEASKKQTPISKKDTLIINDAPKQEILGADTANTDELPTSEGAIFGHSFFKNNNIKFYDKANQLKAPDSYVLGVGDNISIAIWGFSDYNEAFTIDDDGAINPKLVGRIYLNGLTFKDAKALISSKFSRVYDLNNSQIDVKLTYSRVITVNIVGEVNNPGAFTIPAINTAFNALVTVGGIHSIGSVRKIYLKRAGKTVKTLDIYEYLMNPDSKQDFFLENNDYILVSTSERVVKISGQVKRPFSYELIEKENLETLIKYAGGFDAGAYRNQIQVKRFYNNEEIIIDVDYDSLMIAKTDFPLFDGDEVFVRKIQHGYNNFVDLIGPVKLPGQYEIKPDDRVSDIIKRAEGVLFDVFDSRAYIIRVNDDMSKKYIPFNLKEVLENPSSTSNYKLQNFDIIKIFSKSYFKDEFFFSIAGAVRNPGTYTYGEGITLKDALYLAGRLKKEASKTRIEISRAIDFDINSKNFFPIRTLVKTVQIGDNLTIDKASEEFKIQPYDQILVRTDPDFELQKNIVLTGEVMYPGSYALLSKNEKILDIINRAGGLTPWSFTQGAKLTRKENKTGLLVLKLDEVMKDSTSIYNYILRDGDTLNIPKENQLIQIKGFVNYPNIDSLEKISAPFTPGKSARHYVVNYGLGFNKDAQKNKTYVVLPGGAIKRTHHFFFLKFYPNVPKGSVIMVPQKQINEKKKKKASEPIDWNQAIERGTVKLTALITLYLLMSRINIK